MSAKAEPNRPLDGQDDSASFEEQLTEWLPRQVVSIAVLNSHGHILMGKRKDCGRWTLPGGCVNPGEELDDAAHRELQEETGFDVGVLKRIGHLTVTNEQNKEIVVYAYKTFSDAVDDPRGDPDEEVDNWEWIDVTDGLPAVVEQNLYSPRNVTLRFLGLQDWAVDRHENLGKTQPLIVFPHFGVTRQHQTIGYREPKATHTAFQAAFGQRYTFEPLRGGVAIPRGVDPIPWSQRTQPGGVHAEFGGDLGTLMHENQHAVFGNVHQNHGRVMRHKLAHHLVRQVPDRHKDMFHKIIDIAPSVRGAHVSMGDEERLAFLHTYLHSEPRRQEVHQYWQQHGLDSREIDRVLKDTFHHLRSVAHTVRPEHLRYLDNDPVFQRTIESLHQSERDLNDLLLDPLQGEELTKNIKRLLLAGTAMLGSMLPYHSAGIKEPSAIVRQAQPTSDVPKVTQEPQETTAHPMDRFLKAIEAVESSGGKFTEHQTMQSGIHQGFAAVGPHGLMPLTVKGIARRSVDPTVKPLAQLKPEEIAESLKGKPNMTTAVARAHARQLYRRFGGDHARMAYAWFNGRSAASNATDQDIKDHWYVKRFQKHFDQIPSASLPDPSDSFHREADDPHHRHLPYREEIEKAEPFSLRLQGPTPSEQLSRQVYNEDTKPGTWKADQIPVRVEDNTLSETPVSIGIERKIFRGRATPTDLFRSYKHSPHTTGGLFLKYLVHRHEHPEKYSSPETAQAADHAFLTLHQLGKASSKNRHITADALHYAVQANPKLIDHLVRYRDRLHHAIQKGVGLSVKKIDGHPHVALARGLNSSEMGSQHTLSSWADVPSTGFGAHMHHKWVPLRNVWYSFKLGHKGALGNFGDENEYLVSSDHPEHHRDLPNVNLRYIKTSGIKTQALKQSGNPLSLPKIMYEDAGPAELNELMDHPRFSPEMTSSILQHHQHITSSHIDKLLDHIEKVPVGPMSPPILKKDLGSWHLMGHLLKSSHRQITPQHLDRIFRNPHLGEGRSGFNSLQSSAVEHPGLQRRHVDHILQRTLETLPHQLYEDGRDLPIYHPELLTKDDTDRIVRYRGINIPPYTLRKWIRNAPIGDKTINHIIDETIKEKDTVTPHISEALQTLFGYRHDRIKPHHLDRLLRESSYDYSKELALNHPKIDPEQLGQALNDPKLSRFVPTIGPQFRAVHPAHVEKFLGNPENYRLDLTNVNNILDEYPVGVDHLRAVMDATAKLEGKHHFTIEDILNKISRHPEFEKITPEEQQERLIDHVRAGHNPGGHWIRRFSPDTIVEKILPYVKTSNQVHQLSYHPDLTDEHIKSLARHLAKINPNSSSMWRLERPYREALVRTGKEQPSGPIDLTKAMQPNEWGRLQKHHNPAGANLVDHKPHLELFKAPERYVSMLQHSSSVKGLPSRGGQYSGISAKTIHSLGETLVPPVQQLSLLGEKPKDIYAKKPFSGEQKEIYMAKPYHKKIEQKTASWVKHPLLGWSTMATKAMFNAGGIGHLAEDVSAHEHKGLPLTVHKFSKDYRPIYEEWQQRDQVDPLQLRQIAAIDYLTDNGDRHAGNLMIGPQPKDDPDAPRNLLAIDHERSFQYPDNKRRNYHSAPSHYLHNSTLGVVLGMVQGGRNRFTSGGDWMPFREWWQQNGAKIGEEFNKHLELIRDPDVKGHVKRNFDRRFRKLNDWAHGQDPRHDNGTEIEGGRHLTGDNVDFFDHDPNIHEFFKTFNDKFRRT